MSGTSKMTNQHHKEINYAHSIYLTGESDSGPRLLPHKIASNIESFKNHHPDFNHCLFSDESLRAFIKEKFDNDVLQAYDRLIPLAYKADLGRYCLLYEYGGIYGDVALTFHRSFTTDMLKKRSIFLFRDGFGQAPWIVSNSLIFTKRNLRLFDYVINKIVEHTRINYYGKQSLCPTGPNLFGRSVALMLDMNDFLTGEVVRINKNPKTHSFAYLFPDGEVGAVNIKLGNGLSSLGAKHHDDYNHHYTRRNIYNPPDDGRAAPINPEPGNKYQLGPQDERWRLESLLQGMQTEIKELKDQNSLITNSKSWRYTHLLRECLRKIRGLRRKKRKQ